MLSSGAGSERYRFDGLPVYDRFDNDYVRGHMPKSVDFEHIDLHLVRVLHTVIAERNVSRAALRLNTTQPAVSAQLKRLRELTGDPLLVRTGRGMSPTAKALQLVGPAQELLQAAERLFGPAAREEAFEPGRSSLCFRIAASDYLDPFFLPELVAQVNAAAPDAQVELISLSPSFDYRRALAEGDVDLVIGNWLKPPEELHMSRLLSDEIVCLMAEQHPLLRTIDGQDWTAEAYLGWDHVAPMPFHAGAPGVIDEYLALIGLRRRLCVRAAHFSLIPLIVSRTLLVLTTGRLYCDRYARAMPLRVAPAPVRFPPLVYYQLWHDLTHASRPMRWLREQVREVAERLKPTPPDEP